jgi:protein-disulfide isomerase
MANDRQETARWVDERMAALDGGPEWQPDARRALGLLRGRRRAYGARRAGSIGAFAATVAAGLVLVALSGPRACANPMECANEAETAAASADLVRNYKESGPPNAKVTVEIYSDYQCPSCAQAFLTTVPQFVNEYVKTGKVKFIHRDFLLPQHPYSKLAAKYANAAGMLGFYDAAVDFLFRSQATWEKDGSVDATMSKLLPPAALGRVRQLVQTEKSLDETVQADLAMGMKDKINQTPSMIVTANGKRQLIVPVPAYGLLKSYLDDLLK